MFWVMYHMDKWLWDKEKKETWGLNSNGEKNEAYTNLNVFTDLQLVSWIVNSKHIEHQTHQTSIRLVTDKSVCGILTVNGWAYYKKLCAHFMFHVPLSSKFIRWLVDDVKRKAQHCTLYWFYEIRGIMRNSWY